MNTNTTPKLKWKTWHKVVLGILFSFLLLLGLIINKASKTVVASTDKQQQDKAKEALLGGLDSNEMKKETETLLKNFIKEQDDFAKTTFYTHKTFGKNLNNRNTIRAVVRNDGSYYMESNYYGSDWITHTHIILLVNGNTTESPVIVPLSKQHYTDNTADDVWELNKYYETGDNNILSIIRVAVEKEIKVRFTGGSRSVDATLSKADKKAIEESMSLAEHLKFQYNLRN